MVTLRCSKGFPVFQTYSSLIPLWNSILMSPWQFGLVPPANANSCLSLLTEVWEAQMVGWQSCLIVQWNHCLLVEAFLPLKLRTSRLTEHKFVGTGSKSFAVEWSPWVMVKQYRSPCPLLDSWTLWILAIRVPFQYAIILDAGSEHIQSSEEPCPTPMKYCHLAGTGNVLKRFFCY